MKNVKEKIVSATGSISGAASILGSWQICHNICLGLIALLSLVGITVVGMPLQFFTEIAVPMWLTAAGLLIVTILIYLKKPCISKNLIIVNSGIIIAGVPFQPFQQYSLFLWIIGGAVVATGIYLFIRDRAKSKKCEYESKENLHN